MRSINKIVSAALMASMALSVAGCSGSKGISPKAIHSIGVNAGATEYDDVDEFADLMQDLQAKKSSAIKELKNGVLITASGKDIKKLMSESESLSGDDMIYKKSMEEMSYYFVGDVSKGTQSSLFCVISYSFDDEDDAEDYFNIQVDMLEQVSGHDGSDTRYFDIADEDGTDNGIDYYVTEYKIKEEYRALLGENSMNMYAGSYLDGKYVMYYIAMDIGSSTDCADTLDDTCKELGIISPFEVFD